MSPKLGEHFDAAIPDTPLDPIRVAVIDKTSGLFTAEQLRNLIWCLRYQLLFHYNRSPWVQRHYSAPCADVQLVPAGIPTGASVIELLDVASEPGALGWHEDRATQSTAHSVRGVKLHPDTGAEVPWAIVGVKTSRDAGVQPSEVLSHEALEFLVDPWVMSETQLRVYPNPATGEEYIGEVGDPVQDRGYDVGAPEGRPCNVPEAVMADFAYPHWWEQPQRRPACSFCEDAEAWTGAPAPHSGLQPFQLAPGGYMSVRQPGGEWTQIFGSNRQKAEANARAYERPGDVG